jgi:hypothetical protein
MVPKTTNPTAKATAAMTQARGESGSPAAGGCGAVTSIGRLFPGRSTAPSAMVSGPRSHGHRSVRLGAERR